jgi:hypothetical protein
MPVNIEPLRKFRFRRKTIARNHFVSGYVPFKFGLNLTPKRQGAIAVDDSRFDRRQDLL